MTLASSCNGSITSKRYGDNDLELINAFTVKELCSCVFVMGQSEAYCRLYAKQAPAVASARIDWTGQRVTSSAFLLWGAAASYRGPKDGCVVE